MITLAEMRRDDADRSALAKIIEQWRAVYARRDAVIASARTLTKKLIDLQQQRDRIQSRIVKRIKVERSKASKVRARRRTAVRKHRATKRVSR